MSARIPQLLAALGILLAIGVAAAFLLGRPARRGSDAASALGTLIKVPRERVLASSVVVLRPQAKDLTALAIDAGTRIYVGSPLGVEVLDGRGTSLRWTPRPQPVRCLALAPGGDLLVGAPDHIDVLAADGTQKASWPSLSPRSDLTSLAASADFVFAADYVNRTVWRLDRAGHIAGQIDGHDEGRRRIGFVVPSAYFDVAAEADGTVWVSNPGEHRIEHFTPTGRLLGGWGGAGLEPEAFSGCCNPGHIALGPGGAVLTSERHAIRIKRFTREGVLDGVLAEDDAGDALAVGEDLAADGQGRVFALDARDGVVRIYTPRRGIQGQAVGG